MANIYLIMVPFKYTHNMHHVHIPLSFHPQDTWGQQYIDKRYTSLLLIVPSLILALVSPFPLFNRQIVRPQRSGRGFFDFCWAASMYLEGVAILPQLHMFQKNRVGTRVSCELDGRNRVVHVALRVQPLRVQIARVLLLDE